VVGGKLCGSLVFGRCLGGAGCVGPSVRMCHRTPEKSRAGPAFSLAPRFLRPLHFSSACHSHHSPATTILQRLPFSSAYHSPFSSAYHSPATTILQRLPFSSAYHSPFSSAYHSPDYFNAFQQIFCQAATGANFSTRLQQWPTDEL
jgi:hypothetical protein